MIFSIFAKFSGSLFLIHKILGAVNPVKEIFAVYSDNLSPPGFYHIPLTVPSALPYSVHTSPQAFVPTSPDAENITDIPLKRFFVSFRLHPSAEALPPMCPNQFLHTAFPFNPPFQCCGYHSDASVKNNVHIFSVYESFYASSGYPSCCVPVHAIYVYCNSIPPLMQFFFILNFIFGNYP